MKPSALSPTAIRMFGAFDPDLQFLFLNLMQTTSKHRMGRPVRMDRLLATPAQRREYAAWKAKWKRDKAIRRKSARLR